MHYKTIAYSKFVLLVHELRLPCGALLLKTTAYSKHSLRPSSRDDYYVHSFVNQLTNDHYFAVFVLYLRDNYFKMIMRVSRLCPTLASCVISVGRCSDVHSISGVSDTHLMTVVIWLKKT